MFGRFSLKFAKMHEMSGNFVKEKRYFRFNPSLGSSKNLPWLKNGGRRERPWIFLYLSFFYGIQAVFFPWQHAAAQNRRVPKRAVAAIVQSC
jgi:hypothetical protein